MTLFCFPSNSLNRSTCLLFRLLEEFMKIDQRRCVLFSFWSKCKKSVLIRFIFQHSLLDQSCDLLAVVSDAMVLHKRWTVVRTLFNHRCEVECFFEWLEYLCVDMFRVQVYFVFSYLTDLLGDLLLLYFERVGRKVRRQVKILVFTLIPRILLI